MTTAAVLPESNMLRNLQQISEARGLKFYVNPPPDVVPEFLGDLRPDAIARGPQGGIVITVKRRGTPDADQRLVDIAKRVSAQKGWEFQAIYLVPPADEAPAIAKPTEPQLRAAFEQIEALTNGGHHRAALLIAWAALELLARLVNENDEAGTSKAFSPLQAVQTLAEQGYLEKDAAENLRRLAKLRNAVAHGDLSIDVPEGQVKGLLAQLRTIAAEIEAVHD